jgi:hypothetical protein
MANTNYCPQQPNLNGGDGYSILKAPTSGVLMRHKVMVVDPNWVPGSTDTPPIVQIPATHQVNVTEASPQINLPNFSHNFVPGDVWRFSYSVIPQMALKAAGDNHFRIFVNWYTADPERAFIRSEFSPWFSEITHNADYSSIHSRVVGEFIAPPNAGRAQFVAEFQCPSPVNAWAIYDVRYEKEPFTDPLPIRPDVMGATYECNYFVDRDSGGKPYRTRYEVLMSTADVEFYDPEISGMVRLADKPWRLNGINVTPGGELPADTSPPYTWSYTRPDIYTAIMYYDFTFANVTKTETFTVDAAEWKAKGQAAIAEWEQQNPGQTWDPAWNWPGSLL